MPHSPDANILSLEPNDLYDIEEPPERPRRQLIRSPFLPKGRAPKQPNNKKPTNPRPSPKTTNPRPSPKPTNPNQISINNPYSKPTRSPAPSPKIVTPKAPPTKALPIPQLSNQAQITFDAQRRPVNVMPGSAPIITSPPSPVPPVLNSPTLPNSSPKTTLVLNRNYSHPPPTTQQPLFAVTPNSPNFQLPVSPSLTKASSLPVPLPPSLSASVHPMRGTPPTKTIPVSLQRFLPQQTKAPSLPSSSSVPAITKPSPPFTSPILNGHLPQTNSAPSLFPPSTVITSTTKAVVEEEEVPSMVDEFGEHHHISEYDDESGEIEHEDYFSERYDAIVAASLPPESRVIENSDSSIDDDDLDAIIAGMDEEEFMKGSSAFG